MGDVNERRFLNTKAKLESLNYHQPLGIESAGLVEKLLGDLMRTTEAFQAIKLQSSKHSNESTFLHNQLEPLRKTNQRLIRENNQLHSEMIKKDEAEAEKEQKHSEKMRKTENEVNEVKFMNGQQGHRIRALELELAREKKRIEELLQRHIASYVAPTGEVEELSTRAPTMELTSNLDPQNRISNNNQLMVDTNAMADQKIEKLNEQIKALTEDKSILEEKERKLTKQVLARDREVARLARAVEGGSDPSSLALQADLEDQARTISTLRLQLEAFHSSSSPSSSSPPSVDKSSEWQQRVKELAAENQQLSKQNEETTINNKSLLAELKESQQQLQKLKEKAKQSPQISRKDTSKKSEKESTSVEVKKLQQELAKSKKAEEELRSNMTKLDEKNAALTKQIETLEQSAQDLAQELSLSKELSTPTPAHTKEIKQLQDKISQLQEENRSVAYLLDKSEKEKFALLDVISGFEAELASIQQSIKQLTTERDQITESYHTVSEELEEKIDTIKKTAHENAVLTARISALELRVHELSDDNVNLTSSLKSTSQNQSQAQHYQTLLRTMSAQAESLRGANEILEKKLLEMSNRLEEIKDQHDTHLIKDLEDKVSKQQNMINKLNEENIEAQAQISTLKEALLQADSTLDHMEASMKKTSRHTEAYNSTIKQLTSEIDSLRSELKRKDLEISEHKRVIERIDREKDTILQQLDQKDEEVAELAGLKETEVESRERIALSLTSANVQADKLTGILAVKDKEIFSFNSKVEDLMQEKVQLESELVHLHKELDLVTKDFTSLSRDNQSLHTTLDRERSEKEALNKDVRIRYLEEHLKGKDIEREELLDVYQRLGDENIKLTESFKQTQTLVESLSVNLQKQNNELSNMDNHIQEVEQENEHYVLDLQSYERQTDNMSRKIVELEQQLKSVNEERALHEQELLAAREQAVQLIQSKDNVVRELAQARQICDRQGMELQQQASKMSAMNLQVESEAKRIKDLETILKNETLKEAQIHMASQSNAQENERMRENLQRLTNQQATAQQELLALEMAKQKLEDELTKTRRTIITTNYERESVFAGQKELQQRCTELEKMVEDQQQVIQAMDEERARFKTFVMKYETELNKSESRLSEILSQLFTNEQTIKKLEGELKNRNDELILYKSYPARSSPRANGLHHSTNQSPTPNNNASPSSYSPALRNRPPSSGKSSDRREREREEVWSGYGSSSGVEGVPASIPLQTLSPAVPSSSSFSPSPHPHSHSASPSLAHSYSPDNAHSSPRYSPSFTPSSSTSSSRSPSPFSSTPTGRNYVET